MNKRPPQIVAIGGGGFSTSDEDLALLRYLSDLTGKPDANACFIPTASAENETYTASFYDAFASIGCRPSHLPFFERTPLNLREFLLAQDLIYVGGGNTKSMLAVWREWGVDVILQEAWQAGVVLSGCSAGAICWFESGITDSWAKEYRALDCLGFLPGSCCPHFDSESSRQAVYRDLIRDGEISGGIALDDHAAAHFVGTDLKEVVIHRPTAGALRIRSDGDALVQEQMATRSLI